MDIWGFDSCKWSYSLVYNWKGMVGPFCYKHAWASTRSIDFDAGAWKGLKTMRTYYQATFRWVNLAMDRMVDILEHFGRHSWLWTHMYHFFNRRGGEQEPISCPKLHGLWISFSYGMLFNIWTWHHSITQKMRGVKVEKMKGIFASKWPGDSISQIIWSFV